MPQATGGDHSARLLELYDEAVGDVFGYLRARCGRVATAEDLTAETFMSAVDSIHRGAVTKVTVAWLIGIARHKLVDEWRRSVREERRLAAVADDPTIDIDTLEDWDAHLDAMAAHDVLATLSPDHRAALTLRYLDGLPVADVASVIGRTLHATEALLVRARRAFRASYEAVMGTASDDSEVQR